MLRNINWARGAQGSDKVQHMTQSKLTLATLTILISASAVLPGFAQSDAAIQRRDNGRAAAERRDLNRAESSSADDRRTVGTDRARQYHDAAVLRRDERRGDRAAIDRDQAVVNRDAAGLRRDNHAAAEGRSAVNRDRARADHGAAVVRRDRH